MLKELQGKSQILCTDLSFEVLKYDRLKAKKINPKVKVNYISVMGNFANWRATKAKGEFDMKTFEVRAIPIEPQNDLRAGMSATFDWKKLK